MTSATQPVAVEGRYVHANGIDIYYMEAGTGTPLILLHGGLVSTNPIWNGTPLAYGSLCGRVRAALSRDNPDTRGCGKTRHTDGTISVALLADDVAALVGASGTGAAVCGWFQRRRRHREQFWAFVTHTRFERLSIIAGTMRSTHRRQLRDDAPDARW